MMAIPPQPIFNDQASEAVDTDKVYHEVLGHIQMSNWGNLIKVEGD